MSSVSFPSVGNSLYWGPPGFFYCRERGMARSGCRRRRSRAAFGSLRGSEIHSQLATRSLTNLNDGLKRSGQGSSGPPTHRSSLPETAGTILQFGQAIEQFFHQFLLLRRHARFSLAFTFPLMCVTGWDETHAPRSTQLWCRRSCTTKLVPFGYALVGLLTFLMRY
jgi:hypothetical protein